MSHVGHRMNASVQRNVAGYLCVFQKGNASQRKKKLSRLLKLARSGKYTHPLEKTSIYIHNNKKIYILPDFAGTPMFTRCLRWWNKWQNFLISAIGILDAW